MKQEKSRKRICAKRTSVVALTLMLIAAAIPLSSCGSKQETLSMYVGLGTAGAGYYDKVRDAVEKETGVKLEFVYSNSMDTTNSMVNMIQNNDLPADIITTASKTENEYCRDSMLDLAAYTNIPDNFKSTDVENLADEDGQVYQLPFATRLIGIGYNKTLMEEMGWELPKTFDDMVALKAKADDAGVRFAVFCTAATGHGFNNLFHLMGSDYLITPAGTEWLENFQNGKTGIADFAKQSVYFKKYAEAGLFGDVHDEDWAVAQEFSETRCLFYYNIITEVASYDGYQKDVNGNQVGDEPLHDEYGIMPWLSEDGNTNCYTEYNCLYIGLNKKLLEDESKLEAANKVLQYMLSEEITSIFSDYCKDGLVKTKTYDIGKDRLYYEYADQVNKGYTMPWYYNGFDVDSIVNVGEKVNNYLAGDKSGGISDIMHEIEYRNRENLKGHKEILAELEETLDYEDNARLQAISNMLAANSVLKDAGESAKATVALLPYIEDASDISAEIKMPLVQQKMYKGGLETAKLSSYVNSLANDVAIVKMSGKEINQLAKEGFDASVDFGYEHVFDVVCVSEGDAKIDDGKEYLVAIPWQVLGTAKFEEYQKNGQVIMKEGVPLKTTTIEGLNLFFADKDKLSVEDL